MNLKEFERHRKYYKTKNILNLGLKSNGIDDTKNIQKIIKYAIKKQKYIFGNRENIFILKKQLVVNGNLKIYNMAFNVLHQKAIYKLKKNITFASYQCKIISSSIKCLELSKEQWNNIESKKLIKIKWVEIEPKPHNILRLMGKTNTYTFEISTNRVKYEYEKDISNHSMVWVYRSGDKICDSLPNFTCSFYGHDFIQQAKDYCQNWINKKLNDF